MRSCASSQSRGETKGYCSTLVAMVCLGSLELRLEVVLGQILLGVLERASTMTRGLIGKRNLGSLRRY